MLKKRYVIAALGLLIAVFAVFMFILPNYEIETATKGRTYESTVFDQSKVTTVDITLSENDLASILADPTAEDIVTADVTINGETISNVGFRSKGNMTLRSVASMESDRYSWKIDFDYYEGSQSFDGLKKLNLNNGYTDSTYMREYLSYSLMKKMGVATPNYSYMNVTINGKEWGLYLGVEAIEETLLENNFANGTGDLYKPDGTGSDLKWISEDIDDYTGINLKTNEDTSDQEAMINMLDVINNDGNLEDVLDVDEMLRYFAVNTALVNLDHYQGNMKHNYYLYEEDGVFSILPWDYNMAFGGLGGGGNRGMGPDADNAEQNDQANGNNEQPAQPEEKKPDNASQAEKNSNADDKTAQNEGNAKGGFRDGQGMNMGSQNSSDTFMSESNINFSITEPVSGTTMEDRPLLNALLSNEKNREKYYNYLKEIATDFFSQENMTAMTTDIAKLITPYVEEDPTKFYTLDDFLAGVSGDNSLVAFATKRSESILAQLSGDLVVEAETSNSTGEGPGGNQANNENDENPRNMQQPPDMENGKAVPDGRRQNRDGMQPPGMNNEQMTNQQGVAGSSYSSQTLIISGIGLVLLITAMIVAIKFPRRGRRNK